MKQIIEPKKNEQNHNEKKGDMPTIFIFWKGILNMYKQNLVDSFTFPINWNTECGKGS